MPTEREIDIVARTLIGEDDNPIGQAAVAHVIKRRIAIAQANGGKYWWGNDYTSVCLHPYQFSTWLNLPKDNLDANFRRMMSLRIENDDFASAYYVALGVMLGRIEDPTNGATHYHSMYVDKPDDFKDLTLIGKFGKNVFYR